MKKVNNNNNSKKKKRKLPIGIKIFLILINLLTVIFILMTYFLKVIPMKYFIVMTFIVVILDLVASLFLKKKNKNKKMVGIILSLILIIALNIGLFYEIKANDFINKITNSSNTTIENYLVVVRNDSNYKDIKDIKDNSLGILKVKEDGYNKAVDTLSKKVKTTNMEYDDSYSLTDALLSKDIEAFLLEESQEKILEENYEKFNNKVKILYTFNVEVIEEDIKKDVDITKDSFNIFVSGIDTYGNINSVSRSDVNLIMSINPKTSKISLVTVPRDYYVSIYKKNGLKDKLTHAGIYGVDTSVKTLENLLDIDINYYVKFNFTSLIKLVDQLGGVRVYSNYTFDSGEYDENTKDVYHYVKGWNNLNGKQALSFARERHSFNDGDRVRGAHQQALIEAILDKITSPKIITNYSKILDTMSSSFLTNIDDNNLRKFINMQIDKNIKWEVKKFVVNGSNGLEYTYSYPRQKLYVMLQSEESLNTAKEQINSVLNN